MASYQDTVNRMMRQYPNMFPTEVHCLNHLLLVNGNGYWWEGGQLVTMELTDEEVFANRAQRRAELLDNIIEPGQELTEKLRKRIEKFWSVCTKISLYPISKYSAICTIPDDVQSDWLQAAYKAIIMVLQAEPEQLRGDPYHEIELACKILIMLKGRFGKHGKL